jgi:hypothetical protein
VLPFLYDERSISWNGTKKLAVCHTNQKKNQRNLRLSTSTESLIPVFILIILSELDEFPGDYEIVCETIKGMSIRELSSLFWRLREGLSRREAVRDG